MAWSPRRGRAKVPEATEISGRVHASNPERKRSEPGKRPTGELLLRLQLESNPETLCLVRATLQRATEVMKFGEPDSRAIVRSVDEALANVIRHAYGGREGQPIVVTCNRLWSGPDIATPSGLEIILMDSGVPLDARKLQGRSLEDVRPGGLGLHFIQQSMDVVEFSHSNGKNQLRMVKYLASPKPEEKPEGE